MFDTVMRYLPLWLPATALAVWLQWVVIRGAVLSALRRHATEQAAAARGRSADDGSSGTRPSTEGDMA